MRAIYYLLALIIILTTTFQGFILKNISMETLPIFLFLITGMALIFPQKTKKSLRHVPRLLLGSALYGLLIGTFFVAAPIYSYIQEPSITFSYYFSSFITDRIKDILIFSGVSAYAILISGLLMLALKGAYFLFKSTTKNNKIIFIIATAVIIACLFGYFYSTPQRVTNKYGFYFQYPRSVTLKEYPLREDSKYINYTIKGSKNWHENQSSIEIAIPIMNEENLVPAFGFIVDLPFTPEIEDINVNGYKGQKVSYRGDNPALHNDPPILATLTFIALDTRYSFSKFRISYNRYDSDPSLDAAWNMILKTLKY